MPKIEIITVLPPDFRFASELAPEIRLEQLVQMIAGVMGLIGRVGTTIEVRVDGELAFGRGLVRGPTGWSEITTEEEGVHQW